MASAASPPFHAPSKGFYKDGLKGRKIKDAGGGAIKHAQQQMQDAQAHQDRMYVSEPDEDSDDDNVHDDDVPTQLCPIERRRLRNMRRNDEFLNSLFENTGSPIKVSV